MKKLSEITLMRRWGMLPWFALPGGHLTGIVDESNKE